MSSRLLKPRKRNPFQKITTERNIVTPMVREVAQAMCREIYVYNCRDRTTGNRFYEQWPDEEGFVSMFSSTGPFVQKAREALIAALRPESKLPESEKEKIYQELFLDTGLAQAAEKGTVGSLH